MNLQRCPPNGCRARRGCPAVRWRLGPIPRDPGREEPVLQELLVLYWERLVKPRGASDPLRFGLVLLARCFPWREALTIVQPATLIRWYREGFQLCWHWRSRPGRRRLLAGLNA